MSAHLTYLEAVVTGFVQGVSELFPISSLGHNVLLPALVGGTWSSALSVTAPNSPYLAFIVGLHVATAAAMIAYFWRDWLRIIGGFISSVRTRSITTPDERLAWLIILATIPVGLVGLALQKEVTKVFAKAELAAVFLAVNGVILLVSERMRQARTRGEAVGTASPTVVLPAGRGAPSGPVPNGPYPGRPVPGGPSGGLGGPGGPGGPGWPAGPGPEGYSQQPRQQQWQGPDPREWPDPRDPRYGQHGNQRYPGNGQYGGQPQYGQPQHEQPPFRPDPRGGQPQYGREPEYGREPQYGRDPQYGDAPWAGQPQYGREPQQGRPQYGTEQYGAGQYGAGQPGGYDPRDPRAGRGQQQPSGRHGQPAGRPAPVDVEVSADPAVAADGRLSMMGYKRAVIIGIFQVLALLPGISRDGIVTVGGMSRGLTRQDAVRFSFLLSAPVILAAGVLKMKDLVGPASKGMHGPILVGALISGVCAYLCTRFLMKYFSENKSLNPFGIYCLIAGIGSLAFLVLK